MLSCLQFGMWEIQWVHCVLNDADYADREVWVTEISQEASPLYKSQNLITQWWPL